MSIPDQDESHRHCKCQKAKKNGLQQIFSAGEAWLPETV